MRNFYKSPSLIDISITNRCNLKCGFCYAESKVETYSNELNTEELKKIFEEIDKLNVHRVAISGGEPFVRKDIFDIIENFTSHDYSTIINTNATLINDSIAKNLKKYEIDRICVSLDGSNKVNHDAIRGSDTFEKTLKGIQNLQKYNLPVSTLFTLHNKNAYDLIETIKLNEKIGIEYMSVMVVCPTGRATGQSYELTKDIWYPIFNKLTDMKKNGEISIKFKIVPPNESSIFWLYYYPLKEFNRLEDLKFWEYYGESIENNKREISCQAGIKACSIISNGDVYGCDLMIGIEELCAGNIRTDSIENIWHNSNVFERLRKMSFNDIEGKCSRCDNEWCGGGCRSTALNSTGSLMGSDTSCFMEE